MKEVFGYQLLLDLYGVDPLQCDSVQEGYNFLDKIVDVLEMQKQTPPSVFVSPKEFPEKAGLSGWCPLIESHVAVHTITPKGYVSVDVYSCKKFNPEKIEQWVKDYWKATVVDSQFIKRGFNYFSIEMEKPNEKA